MLHLSLLSCGRRRCFAEDKRGKSKVISRHAPLFLTSPPPFPISHTPLVAHVCALCWYAYLACARAHTDTCTQERERRVSACVRNSLHQADCSQSARIIFLLHARVQAFLRERARERECLSFRAHAQLHARVFSCSLAGQRARQYTRLELH